MLSVETFVVRYTATNCYLVYSRQDGEGLIIDPGDISKELWQVVVKLKLKIRWIINTHGHIDHTGGNDWYREKTGAPLLVHELERDFYAEPALNLSTYSKPCVLKQADRMLREGDVIRVGKEELKVLHTPGHTPGSICLLSKTILFSGDTLFAGSIGRSDFPLGSYKELMNSLKTKIMILPGNLAVYPGHGPSSYLDLERRTNPYLIP